MKLPSLNYLVQSARQSFLRFPFTVLSAFVAVCISIYLVEYEDEISNIFPYLNLMLCMALGIPLFFCSDVFAYNQGYNKKRQLLLDLLAALVLVALYFTLPNADSTQNISQPYIRYSIYNITIHLLIAFIPFVGKGQLNGFWHYNKILFVRFLTSLLYSAFLYAGLALALGSLDFLFDIDLHEKLFFDLFIFIIGFFNTWFFVSGIPTRFDTLEEIREYPKGIKIFSQFVLLPLLILYLLILYIYASKIVLLWSWPKGIVSYLIACVAVLGILTLLLIHPYGNLSGNTWIKKFSRAYYFILLPLVVLLFIAIGMRVADYGITINRYIILLLGVWLTIVCTYFIVGKLNIKFIPISLAVALILMSFGYWGMFSVSERSQVARLTSVLEQGKILQEGKIQREMIWLRDSLPTLYAAQEENTKKALLTDSLHNEVKSILDYLDDHHGFSSIRSWYHQDIDSMVRLNNTLKTKWTRINEASAYMRSMGLDYINKYPTSKNSYFSYNSADIHKNMVDVRGYDYMLKFSLDVFNNRSTSFFVGATKYRMSYPRLPYNKFSLMAERDTVVFHTDQLSERMISNYGQESNSEIPGEEMVLFGNSDRLDAKLELHTITFEHVGDTMTINSLSGNIFIRQRKK